ncbi:hypothetical protein PLESHI_14456 [Plesiomonas shigelloides 302-73]|uniref:Uncharacterized protein n=1 Tax=Plesiomonas shigelloides 302-73 TaxID=1315976 RepID=R8ANE9_PLESH|nr:hypothetical protein PLESHI_14456 [Plesiomonas shigelloides 302-73]
MQDKAGKVGRWRKYHAIAMQQAVTAPTGALRAINLNLAAECRCEIQRLKKGTNTTMRKDL